MKIGLLSMLNGKFFPYLPLHNQNVQFNRRISPYFKYSSFSDLFINEIY
jgi:hypothetical protein